MKIFVMVAMGLFIGLSVAQAQIVNDEKEKTQSTIEPTKGKYVDANKNGVCDNYENRNYNVKGKGSGFVDANKDGVCDNREKVGCEKGYGHKHRNRNGFGFGNINGRGNGNGCRYWNGQGKK